VSPSLALVPTGTANTASVIAAFRRLGIDPELTADPEAIERADRVVLPGVGSFGAAGAAIADDGVATTLARRIEEGRPTLAVCVGMQLLAEASEESPGARGLGVVDAMVTRFGDQVRVPQLGWNRVEPHPSARYLRPGWAYFANSFRFLDLPEGWLGATTDHGGDFVSAMERGQVLACQFHPELSGVWGLSLLERWVSGADG
jgi:imidazole glycerol-phosphate synthase subunit HisH